MRDHVAEAAQPGLGPVPRIAETGPAPLLELAPDLPRGVPGVVAQQAHLDRGPSAHGAQPTQAAGPRRPFETDTRSKCSDDAREQLPATFTTPARRWLATRPALLASVDEPTRL